MCRFATRLRTQQQLPTVGGTVLRYSHDTVIDEGLQLATC